MRHKESGWRLGRNTAHRRSLLRNLVTSLIVEERIETTLPKAKALRPQVEKMITLGKRGDLWARRQAAAYLMTREAVTKLFDTVAPRFGDRNGGYLRIVRTGWQRRDETSYRSAHNSGVLDVVAVAGSDSRGDHRQVDRRSRRDPEDQVGSVAASVRPHLPRRCPGHHPH